MCHQTGIPAKLAVCEWSAKHFILIICQHVQVSSVSENYLTCVGFMATSIFGTAFPSKVIYVHFSRHNSCWTDPLWWYRKSSKPSWPKWTIPSLPPQVPHLAVTRWLAGRLLTDLAPKKSSFFFEGSDTSRVRGGQTFGALLKTSSAKLLPLFTEGRFSVSGSW